MPLLHQFFGTTVNSLALQEFKSPSCPGCKNFLTMWWLERVKYGWYFRHCPLIFKFMTFNRKFKKWITNSNILRTACVLIISNLEHYELQQNGMHQYAFNNIYIRPIQPSLYPIICLDILIIRPLILHNKIMIVHKLCYEHR